MITAINIKNLVSYLPTISCWADINLFERKVDNFHLDKNVP